MLIGRLFEMNLVTKEICTFWLEPMFWTGLISGTDLIVTLLIQSDGWEPTLIKFAKNRFYIIPCSYGKK